MLAWEGEYSFSLPTLPLSLSSATERLIHNLKKIHFLFIFLKEVFLLTFIRVVSGGKGHPLLSPSPSHPPTPVKRFKIFILEKKKNIFLRFPTSNVEKAGPFIKLPDKLPIYTDNFLIQKQIVKVKLGVG